MTGTYRINPDKSAKVDAIKRLLDRDSIPYTLEQDAFQWIVIKAAGDGKFKKLKPPTPSIATAPLTSVQCKKREAEAVKSVENLYAAIGRKLHKQWKPDSYPCRYDESKNRHQAIGHALAKVIARHKDRTPFRYSTTDYKELDAACGHRVKRESQLPSHYTYLTEYICKQEAFGRWDKIKKHVPTDAPQYSAIKEYGLAKLDLEYWQEMVRLATDRERKPAAV